MSDPNAALTCLGTVASPRADTGDDVDGHVRRKPLPLTLDPVGVVLLEGARFEDGLEPGSPQPLPAAHVLLEAAIHASDVSASSTSTTRAEAALDLP